MPVGVGVGVSVAVGGGGVSVGWLVGNDWVGVGSRVLVGVGGDWVEVLVGVSVGSAEGSSVEKKAGVGVNGNSVGVGNCDRGAAASATIPKQ